MSEGALGPLAPLAVGVVLGAGAYLVAFMDGWFGARAAKRR